MLSYSIWCWHDEDGSYTAIKDLLPEAKWQWYDINTPYFPMWNMPGPTNRSNYWPSSRNMCPTIWFFLQPVRPKKSSNLITAHIVKLTECDTNTYSIHFDQEVLLYVPENMTLTTSLNNSLIAMYATVCTKSIK